MMTALISLDHTVFFIFNALADSIFGPFFEVVTWWGHAAVCLPIFCVMAYVSTGRHNDLGKVRKLILFSFVLGTVVLALKQGLDRPRPFLVLGAEDSYRHLGETLRHRSFPSGHTATAFWVYLAALGLSLPVHLQRICLILAVLVGVSRVVVGAHFPSDVLGAWFIGGATFSFIYANKRGSKGDAGHEPS